MSKLQQEIIYRCIEIIKISFRNNSLIDDLTDLKIVAGEKLIGNSFQISTAYSVLFKYNESNPDNEIKTILKMLKETLIENYHTNEFNYFNQKVIPDDLDTASSMVRVMCNESQFSVYLENVNQNKHNEFINTWSIHNKKYNIHYFHSTNIYKCEEFYHMDVLLNHLITLKVIFNQNIEDSLATYFKKFNLYNYLYIPTLYSAYLYSKLCVGLKENKLLRPITEIVIRFEKELNFNQFYIYHRCQFSDIRKIIKEENTSDNWLNIAFLFGIIKNYKKATQYSESDLQESLLKIINKNLDTFEPSLYLSIGYTAYKSKLLSRIFLLDTLL